MIWSQVSTSHGARSLPRVTYHKGMAIPPPTQWIFSKPGFDPVSAHQSEQQTWNLNPSGSVPNLRFGTAGPDNGTYIINSVEHITFSKGMWIPIGEKMGKSTSEANESSRQVSLESPTPSLRLVVPAPGLHGPCMDGRIYGLGWLNRGQTPFS